MRKLFNAIFATPDLCRIIFQQEQILSSLNALQAQVAATNQAMAKASALIASLTAELAAAKAADDQPAIDQLAADLASGTAALSAATDPAAPAS